MNATCHSEDFSVRGKVLEYLGKVLDKWMTLLGKKNICNKIQVISTPSMSLLPSLY